MATGYNSVKTGLSFDAETAGEGITLADGKSYNAGELKPAWVEVQNTLGITFEDKYQGNSANKEFDYWKERLNEVDMVSGTALKLTEAGEAGTVVNIAEYLKNIYYRFRDKDQKYADGYAKYSEIVQNGTAN